MPDPLVVARAITKEFRLGGDLFHRTRTLRALDAVDIHVDRGETVALVGESGSGKSTLGRILIRLLEPTAGTVTFDGTDVFALGAKSLRELRRRMQIVFQDPYGSLNPRMRVGDAVAEPLEIHKLASGTGLRRRVRDLFDEVGMDPSYVTRFPHELSGGQRQRVGIARALAVAPDFLVLDEPVSALDVSVQAQVLNLLADLRDRRSLTYLFIAHDLAVVRHLATRVVVLYLGQIMEEGAVGPLYKRPRHPYTAALLDAVPVPDPDRSRERITLRGDITPYTGVGCAFAPRCLHHQKDERCLTERPTLRILAGARLTACHYADEAAKE